MLGWHDRLRAVHADRPELSRRELAVQFGVSKTSVARVLNSASVRESRTADPRRARQKRAWDKENAESFKNTCRCGDLKSKESLRCDQCKKAWIATRRSLVEGMWADGWTLTEIGEVLGKSQRVAGNLIGAGRKNGWDVPFRHHHTKAAS